MSQAVDHHTRNTSTAQLYRALYEIASSARDRLAAEDDWWKAVTVEVERHVRLAKIALSGGNVASALDSIERALACLTDPPPFS